MIEFLASAAIMMVCALLGLYFLASAFGMMLVGSAWGGRQTGYFFMLVGVLFLYVAVVVAPFDVTPRIPVKGEEQQTSPG